MDDATKCEFGDVLFDELEQIAVRRGGFASLRWLKDHDAQIESVRKQVETLKSAEEWSSDLNPAAVITVARSAIDYVVRAHAAVRSVSDLVEVARSRLKAAFQVSEVGVAAERAAEEYRARGLTEEWDRLHDAGTTGPRPVRPRLARDNFAVAHQNYLKTAGLTDTGAAVNTDDKPTVPNLEQERDAVVRESKALTSKSRGASVPNTHDRYLMAVKHHCAARAQLLVAEHSRRELAKYQAEHSQALHDSLRRTLEIASEAEKKVREIVSPELRLSGSSSEALAAIRESLDHLLEALANAGGAIELAASVLLQITDMRNTARAAIHRARLFYIAASVDEAPSPGDYPAARRIRQPQNQQIGEYRNVVYEIDDIVTDAARATALRLRTVGLAFSGGGIRSATFNLGILQGLADLGLLRMFDYLSTVSGGGYIGSWLAAWIRREGGPAGEPKPTPLNASAELRKRHAEAVTRKRQRTAVAIENVEKQLRSSRSKQNEAQRRWVTGAEIVSGIERPGRPLSRVVDEEPEPIHHLRAHSNYLSPRIGATSADTWTMFSVYLRNLMLNQFILQPLALFLVLIPRIFLWAFHLDVCGDRWRMGIEYFTGLVLIASGLLGFWSVYSVITRMRECRRSRNDAIETSANRAHAIGSGKVWLGIVVPLTVMAICVAVLFGQGVEKRFDVVTPSMLFHVPRSSGQGMPNANDSFLTKFGVESLLFGAFVGLVRLYMWIDVVYRSRSGHGGLWKAGAGRFSILPQFFAPFWSGLISGAGLYLVMTFLRQWLSEPAYVAPFFATFGVPLVTLAIGVGSALEVGLVGGYDEEDMREWRASLGARFLMIAVAWTLIFGLSLYGPLVIWLTNKTMAALLATGWITTSALGVLAGRSSKTGDVARRSAIDYLALVAPAVFVIGLLVTVALLACLLEGIDIPLGGGEQGAPFDYMTALGDPKRSIRWAAGGLFGCLLLTVIDCSIINVNLFSMNLFYANRLVRCYLGASRPTKAGHDERPRFAPSNIPVPVREPNPLTGFDLEDDLPLRDLAVVRRWDHLSEGKLDLLCDYRGPYHLINTAMNLVSGTELAWQERMAESFVLSPLYCGSRSTGYRKLLVRRDEISDAEETQSDMALKDGLVEGYGGGLRLGTAVSVSGAAASPNAGYHTSRLVTFLMTVFNVRLGLWLPNPSKSAWRSSGPGFASYLINELTGQTTNKGNYVYLSDGGHFENLGVYELVRRRCRYVVVCDAGADSAFAFWDLGSLVRKCREDFGVRIEIDITPLQRRPPTAKSQWHCALGTIHYEDVDEGASPGVLLYVKPSLTGDEPSDMRNYVVENPDFPHQTTADQFFNESQFESYRVLGQHVAHRVFGDPSRNTESWPLADEVFRRLKRKWYPPLPELEQGFFKAIEPVNRVQALLRDGGHLDRLTSGIYPELLADFTGDSPTVRAEVHAISQMLQAMEIAWFELNFDESASHPMNRGWMNMFRRWTSSEVFHEYWPALRGEYSEPFVQFCQNQLNLPVEVVETHRIGDLDDTTFNDAIRVFISEFRREWPELVPLGGSSGKSLDLPTLVTQAKEEKGRPDGLARPAVWIVASFPPSGARSNRVRYYGLIVAWKERGIAASADRIGLLIWLRGAYRTLTIGQDALKKALEQIRADRRERLRKPYILCAYYPAPESSDGKNRWQGSVWQNFFITQGFHRSKGDPLDRGMLIMERRYDE